MAYRKKQIHIWQFVLQSVLVRLVLVLVFVFVTLQAYEQYQVMQKTADKKTETELIHSNLLQEKEQLEQKIYADSIEYGIESEIRTNLDMQKEGEQVVLILEDRVMEVPERAGPEHQKPEESSPWYVFWD